jgi:hypothetical protein
MKTLEPVADKLSKLLRLLTSSQDGEVVAATRAIKKTLEASELDIHDLADGLLALKLDVKFTEEEALTIYQRGVEDGQAIAQQQQPVTFHSVEPSWNEIARECAAHPQCLRPNEHEFVQDMVRRTVHGGALTPRQADWLRAIYTRVRR